MRYAILYLELLVEIMSYPDKLLRGISGNYITKDGILDGEAFQLDSAREDGFCEISITWFDGPEALTILMRQISSRTNKIQFKNGAAEIDRNDLDYYMKPHIIANHFNYERKPTEDNPYHGNILVLDSLDIGMKRLIKQRLAFLGNTVIHPNPYFSSGDPSC